MRSTIFALAVLAASTALGQTIPRETYQITIAGPASHGYLPNMGVDNFGRFAGTFVDLINGEPVNRAWTYEPTRGYTLLDSVNSSINAVNRNGLIVGSASGAPAVYDWFGNADMAWPNLAGSFLGVNDRNEIVGYVFDPLNSWIQTAVVADLQGNLTHIVPPNMLGSVACGINNKSMIVGAFTNEQGERNAYFWNGTLNVLQGVPFADNVALAVNDSGAIVGFAVTPVDQVLPVLWKQDVLAIVPTVLQLPIDFPNGMVGAVNTRGEMVGTMWNPGTSTSVPFLCKPGGNPIDLNQLKGAPNRVYNLLTAEAINDNGVIIGTAEIFGQTVAYRATPIRPVRQGNDIPH